LTSPTYSPGRLAWQLAAYFTVIIGLMSILLQFRPDVLQYLPLGGTNALSGPDTIEINEMTLTVVFNSGTTAVSSIQNWS